MGIRIVVLVVGRNIFYSFVPKGVQHRKIP